MSTTEKEKEKEKDTCCCGAPALKPPPMEKPRVEKPHVNNVRSNPTMFCCGASEMGNFNYVDPPDGKTMTHYHKIGYSWASQPNAAFTTVEDVKKALNNTYSSAVFCTTGAGQEYMDEVLPKCGFTHVFSFQNPGHANTEVKLWAYTKNPVKK